MRLSYIIFVLTIVATVDRAVATKRLCGPPSSLPPFDFKDLHKLTRHTWYLQFSYVNTLDQPNCSCYTMQIKAIAKNIVKITNCCLAKNSGDDEDNEGKRVCNFGITTGTLQPHGQQADLHVTVNGTTVMSDAWIFDTDKKNLLVVSACDRVTNGLNYWAFSSTPTMTEDTEDDLEEIEEFYNIDDDLKVKQKQNCEQIQNQMQNVVKYHH